MTGGGFDDATRAGILGSAFGKCAKCGSTATQAHHRLPRGMGGTSDHLVGEACNGIPLCTYCHGWVESHRDLSRDKYGWLITNITDTGRPWWAQPWNTWLRWTLEDPNTKYATWLVETVNQPPPA